MFKKAFIPALALVAASVALPAAAQNYGPQHGPSRGPAYSAPAPGWNAIAQRKFELDRRIDQGVRMRQISPREASRLKGELNSLVRLEARYMRNGLTRAERTELTRRYDRLAAQVRYDRWDHNGRRR